MRIDLSSGAAVAELQVESTPRSHSAQNTSEHNGQARSLEGDLGVGGLAAAALKSPEIRTDKVQALQQQLQAGAYQVSAAQVAGSMLEQMRVSPT
jgi:flagellar biosynthesis anti-sigma factor FlgM